MKKKKSCELLFNYQVTRVHRLLRELLKNE